MSLEFRASDASPPRQGFRDTWLATNETAIKLGHIESYSIFCSDLPQSGDFNTIPFKEVATSAIDYSL